MCGISGLYAPKNAPPLDHDIARAMSQTLRHRGPDRDGFWESDHALLTVNQFKIFLSEDNRQPVANETKSIIAACNGEIYNHQALRRELHRLGHEIHGASDVDVLPHLYEEYGDDFVLHLEGIFAIALYDRKKHRLVLARDRLGVKPLYYTRTPSGVAFASELKAFASMPDFPKRINEHAVWDYLSFGYIPAPQCIFKNVTRIPAATKVVFEEEKIIQEVYWDIPPVSEHFTDHREAAEEVGRLLQDAVSCRLHGNLPIGLMLSGGMDSGLLLHILSSLDLRQEELHTYCATFSESGFNEGAQAKFHAARAGAIHHEALVTPDSVTQLPHLVWHLDGLSTNAPSLAHLAIAAKAREHTPVLLSGEGSDELFFGYETYRATSLVERFGSAFGKVAGVIAAPLLRIPPMTQRAIGLEYMAGHFLKGLSMDALRAHVYWREYFQEEQKIDLMRSFWGNETPRSSYEAFSRFYHERKNEKTLALASYGDIRVWLPENNLAEVDGATMAHTVETRVPFLDHRLVELVAGLPLSIRHPKGRAKGLLIQAFQGKAHPQILRAKKKHLSVPLRFWFAGPLRNWLRETLSAGRIKPLGFLEKNAVDRLVQDHLKGKRDNGRRLWLLVNLVTWHEVFIQKKHNLSESPGPVADGRSVIE